jgi:hypothetical protein
MLVATNPPLVGKSSCPQSVTDRPLRRSGRTDRRLRRRAPTPSPDGARSAPANRGHTEDVGSPEGFTFTVRKNGDVVIRHHDQVAATLRGARAAEFVVDVVIGDDQELMARMTGNYKRGNERVAANHVRNRRS